MNIEENKKLNLDQSTEISSLRVQLNSKVDIEEVYTRDEIDELKDELREEFKQEIHKANSELSKGLSTNDFTNELKTKLVNLRPAKNGERGEKGDTGEKGEDGLSAYQVALKNGYKGTEAQWIESLNGVNGKDGKDGKSGTNGKSGLSAYQIAVKNGFIGTEKQWLESLRGSRGANGASAYQIAYRLGFRGTESEWLDSLQGTGGGTTDYNRLRNKPDLEKYSLKEQTFNKDEINAFLEALREQINNLPSQDLTALTSDINSLKMQISNKVNTQEGFGLSQNNFTNEMKEKLERLSTGIIEREQFVHNQEAPLEIWEIEHGLNKYPSVTVIDSAQSEVEGAVTHISKTKIKINFSSPFSGKAILQ